MFPQGLTKRRAIPVQAGSVTPSAYYTPFAGYVLKRSARSIHISSKRNDPALPNLKMQAPSWLQADGRLLSFVLRLLRRPEEPPTATAARRSSITTDNLLVWVCNCLESTKVVWFLAGIHKAENLLYCASNCLLCFLKGKSF